ncbi:transmembrane protein 230-like [Sturnira hondurensis]|uniref:transmembrane protein 230-like n=1 Tax=Sturnira hondurensis TaxID=192404 RepID=UPI00187A5F43|nr:transmembrane protein 230-like [Sturnira hondurensis]
MPSPTNLAPGIPSSKVRYSRLSSRDDGYTDLQFKKSPFKQRIPHKAILLITVLFLIGTFLSIIGSFLPEGYISQGAASGWGGGQTCAPVLISDILVLLLEFFHLHIACHASKGCLGYSSDDIPGFDDQHPPQP